jgi:hypothetical protein
MDPMNMPANDELHSLLEYRGPCASVYVPFHPGKRELRADLLTLKNEIDAAEGKLTALEVRPTEARDMLRPAAALIEDLGFWLQRGQGVVLFLNKGGMRAYHLPYPCPEWLVVARRFHCKPLLTALSHNLHFYVLALTLNQTRLLRCTMYTHEPVEVPNIPKGLDDFQKYDVPPERGRPVHHPAPIPTPDRRGGGGGPEFMPDRKEVIYQYFRRVDDGVCRVLRDEKIPLILAGVEHLLPLYREGSRYGNIIEPAIAGSQERVADEKLVEQARAIMKPRYDQARRAAEERLGAALSARKASTDLKEVLSAASQGKVATLFIRDNVNRWGTFDPRAADMQLHREPQPGDEELTDLAAALTHLNRGTIFTGNGTPPNNAEVAAEFRY